MIKMAILVMAYLIIGCLFAIATVTLAGEDAEEGTTLAFMVLSFFVWPVMVLFFIAAVALELFRRLRDD